MIVAKLALLLTNAMKTGEIRMARPASDSGRLFFCSPSATHTTQAIVSKTANKYAMVPLAADSEGTALVVVSFTSESRSEDRGEDGRSACNECESRFCMLHGTKSGFLIYNGLIDAKHTKSRLL